MAALDSMRADPRVLLKTTLSAGHSWRMKDATVHHARIEIAHLFAQRIIIQSWLGVIGTQQGNMIMCDTLQHRWWSGYG